MARLITSGAELRDHPTTDVGSPDGVAAGTALRTTDTTNQRSGFACFKYAGTSTDNSYTQWSFTAPAMNATVFARTYQKFDGLPTNTVKIAAFRTVTDGPLISIRLTSTGALQLWDDVANVQVGSDSTMLVETGRYYRLQLKLKINTGATDEAELLVQTDDYQTVDEPISATGLSISDTHASRFCEGWIGAPGVAANIYSDDVAGNDSTGTDHNGYPNEGRVGVLRPMGATSNGVGSWTDCSGAAQPWNGMNKKPPVGLADHTTAGHTGASAHQARVAVNTQQSMQVRLQSYAGAGLMMSSGFMPTTVSSVATTNRIGQTTTNSRRAQSFIFGESVAIDSISIAVGKVASPTDNVVYEVQTSSGGLPSGTVLATATLSGASLGTSAVKKTIVFDKTVAIAPDTEYWIVVSRSGAVDTTNHYFWGKESTGALDLFPDIAPAVYNGTSWVQTGTAWSIGEHALIITPTAGLWPPTYATQFICHGQGATGVKSGDLATTTGGSVVPAAKTFNFGDNVGVAGTYPTNWRWAVGVGARVRPTPNASSPFLTITKLSGSGTNACLACAAGLIVEYALPPTGWARWQKTSDSSFWWGKQAVVETAYECGTDGATIVTISAGSWAMYPEPQVDIGDNFPETLVEVANETVLTTYTPA